MKALCFNEHGELDVIRYGDVPDPTPGPGEVLVRVRACSINHLDIWVRRGWPGLLLEMPHWGAADMAGDIMEIGPQVDERWKTGQRVVADPGITTVRDEFTDRGEPTLSPGYQILGEHIRGAAAEYVVVPAVNLVEIPDSIDYVHAAAPLLVSLTAWRQLIHRAKLRPGETVLVVGAGGGVNSIAIQVAKLAGAFVYVVASNSDKAERAKELGADVVVDRSQVDWGREIFRLTKKRGVDVVVDNVGKATLMTSMKSAVHGGRIVIVGNTSGPITEIDIRYIFGKQLSLIGSTMGTHQDFREVTSMLWQGKLQPVIHQVLPLSEGKEAFAMMERSAQFGKIVLTP